MNSKIDQQLFSAHEHALDKKCCPQCQMGELQLRHGKHGAFLGCSQYPACDYIQALNQNDGHIIKSLQVVCPKCQSDDEQGELVLRQGRYGMFIGCSRFPQCHHIEPMQAPVEGAAVLPNCSQECHSGHLLEKKSRYGKTFYACDAYPSCKFSVNFPPVAGECNVCHFPLLIEKSLQKGKKIICASRRCQQPQS